MKLFATKRLAYFEDFESDPKIQEAIKSMHSDDRFVVADMQAPAGQRNSFGKKWNPEVFKNENVKFEADYVILAPNGPFAVASLDTNSYGEPVFNRYYESSLRINPTDGTAIWDKKSKTIIYVQKHMIEKFNTNREFRIKLEEVIDSTHNVDSTVIIKGFK